MATGSAEIRLSEPTAVDAVSLRVRLVVLSFLMLFVELALIRWLGANVLYLSFFSNIVLLGSFLGVGVGFLWAGRRSFELLRLTPIVLGALVVFVHFVPVKVVAAGGDLIFFGAELKPDGPPRWIMLPLVFLAVAAVLMCIGDGVARTFKQLGNLEAYQFDIVGSVLGVVIFTILAFVGAQPIVWGTAVAIVILWATRPTRLPQILLVVVPLVAMVGTLATESFRSREIWTPYYKVTYSDLADIGGAGIGVFVNGVPHWFQTDDLEQPLYSTVYDRWANRDEPGNVLVIGSGSGNDVAEALEQGADHVDAVEIDPRLLDLGKKYAPDKPYDSPKVDAHVNDGRAYLEQHDGAWDLIVLALPDSITLVQGASSIRLESFLFTKEAAEAYRDHLEPGGVFSMYNFYRQPWLVDRYAATLEEVFGHAPCVTRLQEQASAVLTIGLDANDVDCPLADQWARPAGTPKPVTDDRPFPYLRTVSIPGFYLVSLGLILLISLVAVRVVGGPFEGIARYADLFFMGVAFLLLETKNVVQFALLFGTTWLVNALVFAGVLLAVLGAVVLSRRFRVRNLAIVYGLLALSIVVAWIVPQHELLALPIGLRLVVAILLAFTPIFLANMVFAQRFRDTADSVTSFGANLLGAMVGGVIEYSALLLGYRNLLMVALAVYGLAFLTGRKYLRAAA